MKDKKKSFRKEIRQADEFETFGMRVIEKATRHRRELSMGLAGLLVLILLIATVAYYIRNRERKAAALFSQAQDLLYAGSAGGMLTGTDKPPAPDPATGQEAVERIELLVKKYGGTDGGQLGRLLLGRIYYDRGDFASAAGVYRDFLDGKSESDALRGMAWEGLAYAQEAGGDYGDAVESFKKMSQTDLSFVKGWAYVGMARCYERMGNPEKTMEAYRQLLAENPQHSLAEEARANIAKYAKRVSAQSAVEPDISATTSPDYPKEAN